MQGVVPASSPVARDHWRKFELIIRESGDEGSDGKGRKSEATFPSLSFFFPLLAASIALYACSHHPSPALVSRDLDLGKPVEEAGCCTVFIYFDENDSDGSSGL